MDKPVLAGFPAFKVGMIQVITLDDREKTPNFGKPMFNPATVLSAPSVNVYGYRAYGKKNGIEFALIDAFADNLSDEIREKLSYSKNSKEASQTLANALRKTEEMLKQIHNFTALVGVTPSDSGLSNDIPQVQEVGITGGDLKAQLEYLKGILGKSVKASEYFRAGSYVDTIAITKGKGFEGVIKRIVVKRKQHK